MAKKKTTGAINSGAWFPHCEQTEWLLHRTAWGAFQDEPPEHMPAEYYVRHQRAPQPGGEDIPAPVLYTLTEAGRAAQAAAHARRDQVLVEVGS